MRRDEEISHISTVRLVMASSLERGNAGTLRGGVSRDVGRPLSGDEIGSGDRLLRSMAGQRGRELGAIDLPLKLGDHKDDLRV